MPVNNEQLSQNIRIYLDEAKTTESADDVMMWFCQLLDGFEIVHHFQASGSYTERCRFMIGDTMFEMTVRELASLRSEQPGGGMDPEFAASSSRSSRTDQ
jgi:hypothetical protein